MLGSATTVTMESAAAAAAKKGPSAGGVTSAALEEAETVEVSTPAPLAILDPETHRMKTLGSLKEMKVQETLEEMNRGKEGEGACGTLESYGAPIPPSKVLSLVRGAFEDKENSLECQMASWELLGRVLDDAVGRLTEDNVKEIAAELMAENLVRGKGLLCASLIKHQAAHPDRAELYAALVATVNRYVPIVGYVLFSRLIYNINMAFRAKDEGMILNTAKFLAHLANWRIIVPSVLVDLLGMLLRKKTDAHTKIAAKTTNELVFCRMRNTKVLFDGVRKLFDDALNKGEMQKEVSMLVEDLLGSWDAKFEGDGAIRPGLEFIKPMPLFSYFAICPYHWDDICNVRQKYTVTVGVTLDLFEPDPIFLMREMAYGTFRKNILMDGYWNANEDSFTNNTHLSEVREQIISLSRGKANMMLLGDELLSKFQHGEQMNLCWLLLEYVYTFVDALVDENIVDLAVYLCSADRAYRENLERCFLQIWLMTHGLRKGGLGLLGQLFGKLLVKDLLSWDILKGIEVNAQNVTLHSRCFLEALFMVLVEGLTKRELCNALWDPSLKDVYEVLFPKSNIRNAEFAFTFFKSIDLQVVARPWIQMHWRQESIAATDDVRLMSAAAEASLA